MSKLISPRDFYRNGRLDKTSAFIELMAEMPIGSQDSIGAAFKTFDKAIQDGAGSSVLANKVAGALNNAHGDWYEWILALEAWRMYVSGKSQYLAVLLPNVKGFDVANLYEPSICGLIGDLRTKVREQTSVQLITSNPDFAIVDVAMAGVSLTERDTSYSLDTIKFLDDLYKNFIGKCSLDALVGFSSVKTSLRPDRRLQIPHEGSLMKAIYTHIQTRMWIIDPPGLRYYAIAQKVSDADRSAFKTVATHSITAVQSKPQAAVDAVYAVDTVEGAREAFKEMLNPPAVTGQISTSHL